MRSWWCLNDVRRRLVFCCCDVTCCCCCWWTPLAPPIDPIVTQPFNMEEQGDEEDVSSIPAPSTLMYESSSPSFIKLACMSDEDLMLSCIRRLVRTRWFFNDEADEPEAGEFWWYNLPPFDSSIESMDGLVGV